MAANVEYSFQRGFLLDEVKLRKIHELVNSRVSVYSPPLSPVYKVYRGNSSFYETRSVDEVAQEDNDDWRRITRLEVRVKNADSFYFKLTFSRNGATLEITGADRDAVFLLYSDLLGYIQGEVATTRILSDISFAFVFLTMLLVVMIGSFIYEYRPFDLSQHEDLANKALATTDIGKKLDFMIRERKLDRQYAASTFWVDTIVFSFVLSVGCFLLFGG